MDIISSAKQVFDTEINALNLTKNCLGKTFEEILFVITKCRGKVVVTGIGKSGHVARKMAATLSSLGTPSFYLDPAEAMHGDLGMVSNSDVAIMISYSGESNEIISIIPGLKVIGAKLVAITGNKNSTLSKHADIIQVLPPFEEACNLGLAPTSSTTAVLCYGDALAIAASKAYGFKDTDFGKFHPAGALGKKLIYKVEDIMAVGADNAVLRIDATLNDAIFELTLKKLGLVTIIDSDYHIKGVITTGDLGRQLRSGVDIYKKKLVDVMTVNPKVIEFGRLAVEALNIMKENNIYSLPVIKNDVVVGTINMQRILNTGIIEDI